MAKYHPGRNVGRGHQ